MSGLKYDEKMVSTTVYMTKRQRDLLLILSRSSRVPVSEFVRQGIDKVLEENAVPNGQLRLPL